MTDASFPALLALGVTGMPRGTSRDDAVALAGGPLKELAWPDGSRGIRGTDVIVFAAKFIARCEGRMVRAGESASSSALSTKGVPEGVEILAPKDPERTARELRRGLAARFGGRPGVIITGSGAGGVLVAAGRAGVDETVGDARLSDALATMANAIMAGYPDTPVVVIRGAGHLLTYED